MKFFPKQKWAFNTSNARLNFLDGSVRSGKTYVTNNRFIHATGEDRKGVPPEAIDVMVGKTLDSLKRNVITPIEILCGHNAVYKPGKREFHLFGNVIHTIGANDERSIGKIQGATIRKALGDEVCLWPFDMFKMLDSRLSCNSSQFFGTLNPDNPKHPLKVEYLDRANELDLKRFKFHIDDNNFLPANYVKAIKQNYTGLWYKRFIDGLWCVAEGAVYDFFDTALHCIINPPPANRYVLGIDYGASNPYCAILYGINRLTKPQIWAWKEFYYDPIKNQQSKTNDELARDTMDFCEEHLGPYWMSRLDTTYIDPSAESMQIELERKGFGNIVHANNDVLGGICTVSTMLKRGDYVICQSGCPNYIDEMYSYMWDKKAQERGEDKPIKKYDHCQDNGRYVVHTEFGNLFLFDALL